MTPAQMQQNIIEIGEVVIWLIVAVVLLGFFLLVHIIDGDHK